MQSRSAGAWLGFDRVAVAIARKLAVMMHSMLITGEPFQGAVA